MHRTNADCESTKSPKRATKTKRLAIADIVKKLKLVLAKAEAFLR